MSVLGQREQGSADTRAEPDLLKAYDCEATGVPIGRPAEVNIRNNHLQYVFTW